MAVDQGQINVADEAQRVAKENLFVAEDNLAIRQAETAAAQAALDEAQANEAAAQSDRDDAAETYGQQLGIYNTTVESNGISIPPTGGILPTAERIKPLAK